MLALILTLTTTFGARADAFTSLQTWRRLCQDAISATDHRELKAEDAERAAVAYAENTFPIESHAIGWHRILFAVSGPIPSRMTVTCANGDACEAVAQISVGEAAAGDGTGEAALNVPRARGLAVPMDFGDDWHRAFPDARVKRVGVTHAGFGLNGRVHVTSAVSADTREDLPIRVEFGYRGLVDEAGRITNLHRARRVRRFTFYALHPRRAEVLRAARAYLALTSPSLAALDLVTEPVGAGFMVGFKKNPVLGTPLRNLDIFPVGAGRYEVRLFSQTPDLDQLAH